MTTPPIRLAINGASGRMGSALLALLRDDSRFELVHAMVAPGSADDGQPVNVRPGAALRFAHDWGGAPALDVMIDFSGPDGLAAALAHCSAKGVALVVGTTGLGDALETSLAEAVSRIAVLRSANFSLGVAVLARLLRQAAAALADWDLEIVEAHHGRKEDAPSGTALLLGEAVAAGRGIELARQAVFAREGRTGPRKPGDIGFAALRGGEVVGDHTVMFASDHERLELTHKASSREVFARGAVRAALWVATQKPGRYSMADVLGFTD